ncbi:MAG: hypothetical protein P4L40_03875 [Terracidiphilus sp.]|nr:hypothetical protein [Terracidiphilus sp.]
MCASLQILTGAVATMSTPAVSALPALQRSIAALAIRILSLPRRFAVSHASVTGETSQLTGGLTAAGREVALACGVLATHLGKALDAEEEEARVSAAQLEAYAELLERETEDEGEESGVAGVAHALLTISSHPASSRAVAIAWENEAVLHAVEAAVRLRDGVDPATCRVSGEGVVTYLPGEVGNYVTMLAVDGEGDVVESIEAEDVCVSLHISEQGANVASVTLAEAGVVDVVYRMPEGSVAPLTLGVSVCGTTLSGSPITVTRSPLCDSETLATVANAGLLSCASCPSGCLDASTRCCIEGAVTA